MNCLIAICILSPVTALIPGIYSLFLIYKNKLKIRWNYWSIGILLLFFSFFISSIINKSFLSLIGSFLLLFYFGAAVICMQYFSNLKKVDCALNYIISFSTIAAIAGIGEKILFFFLGKSGHRIYSCFGNPNMAGAWFASCILILLYLKGKNNNKNKLHKCMCIIVAALLFTESTGALIALLSSIVIYYLFKEQKEYKSILSTVIGVVFVTLLFILFQKAVNSITVKGEIVESFNSRYDIWLGSFIMIRKKPLLGWGPLGTLENGAAYMYHNGNVIHSHNVWLTLLTAGGLISLGIYIFIKINLFFDVIRLKNKQNVILPLILALNTMVIVQGLVDCTLYAPQLGMLFIFVNSVLNNLANGMITEKAVIKAAKIKSYYMVKCKYLRYKN